MTAYQAVILVLLLGTALLVWLNLREYRRPTAELRDGPLVSILVPARNEAANIEACLEGLLAQSYRNLEVRVLDDASADDTAERVRRLAARDPRVRLVEGGPLPRGWAGKAHACWQVSRAAEGEWLLFVDADTRHRPELLSRALAEAERARCDLLSTFPRQVTGSLGEALTAPFIYWVLFTLLPFRRVRLSPSPAFAAACGQFLLVRRTAYEASGGHAALRASLHDGLHLARLFKGQGRRIYLSDLSDQITCRMYHGWSESWRGFTRNAYQGIGSPALLLFLTAWHLALGLAPFAWLAYGALTGWPAWSVLAAAQVAVLLGIQLALRARFGYSWATVLLHPLGMAVLVAIQWASWWGCTLGRPRTWKDRPLGVDRTPERAPSGERSQA